MRARCVLCVYVYIDAQQIFCDVVVQYACSGRKQKTVRISHRAARRVFGAPGL